MKALSAWTLPAALLLTLSAAARADEPSPAVDARIVSVEGDVAVFHGDQGEEGVEAEEGLPLDAGDRVKTGPDGRAEVGLDGDGVVELGPRTEFTVSSVERKAAVFGLNAGSLLAKLRSLFAAGGGLSVRTPTAVASVRGTEFAVDVDESGDSHVGVFDDGKVAVSEPDGGEEAVLTANQEVSLARGFNIRELRIGRLERFKARLERMPGMRERARRLRARWKALPPPLRQSLRKKMFERRREIRRKVRERRREIRRREADDAGEKRRGRIREKVDKRRRERR